MRYDDAIDKHAPLDAYERGMVDALYQYAWHKDGAMYVGSTGTLLGDAVDRMVTEHRARPTHPDDRTLEHVARDVKDRLGCYCVSVLYGSQDMGLDDCGVRDGEREAMVVAAPGGFLGGLRVIFQGTVLSLKALDLYAEPTAVSNPPARDELRDPETLRLRPGAFVYGNEDAVRDWPAKLAKRRDGR